jgi:hypothetical protein
MLRYGRKPAIPVSGFRFGTPLKIKRTELRDIHNGQNRQLARPGRTKALPNRPCES